MGSFSFIRADVKGSANILYGDVIKLLIPIEFGGGYIKGKYVDYGRIDENGIEYDIYELAGIWNSPKILKALKGLFSNPARKQSDTNIWNSDNERNLTDIIRNVGIDLTVYDVDHAKAKYPIKIDIKNSWKQLFLVIFCKTEIFSSCKKSSKYRHSIIIINLQKLIAN